MCYMVFVPSKFEVNQLKHRKVISIFSTRCEKKNITRRKTIIQRPYVYKTNFECKYSISVMAGEIQFKFGMERAPSFYSKNG